MPRRAGGGGATRDVNRQDYEWYVFVVSEIYDSEKCRLRAMAD